ncbi:MAG: hypothetical protein AB7S83_00245 [Candidatus Methanomethylophilaceae archaeon]
MESTRNKMKACLKLLSISAIISAILFMSTIGVGHSAEISKMANTDNTVGAKGTELKLTNTARSLLSNGEFDGTFGTGGRVIEYHHIEVDGSISYVLDGTDLCFGYAKIATSSTNGVTDVVLLCSADFRVGDTDTPFTGLSYHFTVTDSHGNETVIPSYGLATTISDLNGKTLNIIVDGLTEDPLRDAYLTFSVNISFAGLGNVVTNSGNQLSFRFTESMVVIDTTVAGDPDATPVATVTPTTVASGGVEYPGYEIDYTAPPQTGWSSFDATIAGTFCFKFTLQKSITIQSGGYSYYVSSGTNYYSFINGVTYSSSTVEGITWMSSSEPITFTIHRHDANAGAFMTVIYPQS